MSPGRPPGLGLALALVLAAGPAPGREPEADPDRVAVSGPDDPRLEPFDRLMRGFVARNRVPGAALAVTRRGRLVYARGFGFADLDAGTPVRPDALFRVASVSKPLTAVAVLGLIDRGELRPDARALDALRAGASGAYRATPADPRWGRVTVRELLQHRGGWDREVSFDPMFRSVAVAREFAAEPPAGPELVIRSMLRRPLDFDPGARYAYSNFGYCVLGRVIEAVTGEPYGEAVAARVLRPLGIGPDGARLGRTLPAGRRPGEVRYYDQGRTAPAVVGRPTGRPVPEPYGAWSLEAMDAHGGWVASAPALVRFASAFDDPGRCPVLSARSVASMFARPPGAAGFEPDGRPRDAYYGCGWQVRPVGPKGLNAWHSGSLPGTASLLVRRHDGLNWAVLFNTGRGPDGRDLAGAVDGLVHKAADAVREWPARDLFAEAPTGPPRH